MNRLWQRLSARMAGFVTIYTAAVFLASYCLAAPQRVGGPCTYKQYKGRAEIISVIPRDGFPGEYEIRFSFRSQKNVQEEFARIEGRQWVLVHKDSSYPKESFLAQYGIKTGKRLPCYMKVITQGTCTPVLFDFPTIGNGKAQ